MLIVPTESIPNQTLQVQLAGQICQLNVYQTPYGLFMDVTANGILIIASVLCKNGTLIVRNAYLGFTGDFCFIDMQDASDPVYTGLGSQYLLLYLAPTDLKPGQA